MLITMAKLKKIIKNLIILSVDEDMEKLKLSYFARENAKMVWPLGKTV